MAASALRGWANALLAEFEMPGGRFFVPTAAFFAWLDTPAHRALHWVEAGAGSGELAQDLLDRGFRLTAVDVAPREGQLPCVERLDARDLPYSRTRWALVCRPNHNGWTEDLIDRVNADGGTLVYISKAENVEDDLGEAYARAVRAATGVGEADEELWVVAPSGT
jgi:hypothetical protein